MRTQFSKPQINAYPAQSVGRNRHFSCYIKKPIATKASAASTIPLFAYQTFTIYRMLLLISQNKFFGCVGIAIDT